MAAVEVVRARPVTPVGYEVVDAVMLGEGVMAGDLLINTANGWVKCPVGATEPHGIALQDGYEGQGGFDVGIQGEMDGFRGLTPGQNLWRSGSVPGGLDTTAVSGATVRIRAVNGSRIRYNFV